MISQQAKTDLQIGLLRDHFSHFELTLNNQHFESESNARMGGSQSKEEKDVVVQNNNNGAFYSFDMHIPTIITSFAMVMVVVFFFFCCCIYCAIQYKLRTRSNRRYRGSHRYHSGSPGGITLLDQYHPTYPPGYPPMLHYGGSHVWQGPHGIPPPVGPHPRFEEIRSDPSTATSMTGTRQRPSDV